MSMPINSISKRWTQCQIDHCDYGLVNRKYGILYRTQLMHRELEVRRRNEATDIMHVLDSWSPSCISTPYNPLQIALQLT